MSLLEAGSRKLIVIDPDETLHEAAKLLRNNIGRLRVVDGKDRRRVVGYLGSPGKQISLTLNFSQERSADAGQLRRGVTPDLLVAEGCLR
jgi:CBS domain